MAKLSKSQSPLQNQTKTRRTPETQETLRTAIMTICDPRGNWDFGWRLICELAGVDASTNQPPFRQRSEEEMRALTKRPGALKLPPRNPN